ncbi:MAG: glucose 1-dehydrogenase [Proteobacteria bacterium]|nr:glucose 1-dehydrogenase [Pseudomonadota bacterium]HQR05160.1 glucose 1-dehydrogenase [Rhodocyclaceae bacterium]
MQRLQDKVAIITGGARGMGAATARLFATEGARVVITDVLDADGAALATELGGGAVYRHLDVTDENGWRQVVQQTEQDAGRIDILINNAGILMFKSLLEIEKAEFEKVLNINLVGAFLGIRSVAPGMIRQGRGAIVNISSVDGMKGANGLGAYASSKWGLRGLTRVAAMELGHKGIRVNSVHPGGINTIMANPNGAPRSEIDKYYVSVPLQHAGEPEEVAKANLYLASDEAAFVTGAEIAVDGGMVIGRYYEGLPGAPGS